MIELANISGGYEGQETVKDISLSFPDKSITVIIGPNGCGKSTLLKLCCGQLASRQNGILVDEKPLSNLSRTEIARTISFLPQNRTIPDITVDTLVLHGRFPWLGYPRVYRDADRTAAEAAMKRTGILPKRHKLLARLSGGERQKAYLAMLLAQDTQNILLDEPTTYLDIAHQLELMALLDALKNEGKCVVVVLHNLEQALELADKIAVMKYGRLLDFGTPEKIISSGAVEDAFGVKLKRREQYGFQLI